MCEYLVDNFDKGIFDILKFEQKEFEKKLGFSMKDEDYGILIGYSEKAKKLYEKKKEEEEKEEKDGIEKAKKGLIGKLTQLAKEDYDCRKAYADELETIKKVENVANVPILTKQLNKAINGIKYNYALSLETKENKDLEEICQKIEEVFQKAKECKRYYNEKEIKEASEKLIPKLKRISSSNYNRREEYEKEISNIKANEKIEIIKGALDRLSTAISFGSDNVDFLEGFGVKLKEEGLEKELQEGLCKEMEAVFNVAKSCPSNPAQQFAQQQPPRPQQQFPQQQQFAQQPPQFQQQQGQQNRWH